jgi:hypothetical protein
MMIIVGIGHGLVLNAQNFATQAIALPKDEASAAGMYAFLRSLGSALGVGIGGSIFQNFMRLRLKHYGLPVEIATNAEGYIRELWAMPADSTLHRQVLDAYVFGIRGTFGVFCGMAGLAGFASLLIKHFDMNKQLDSDHKLGQMRGTKKKSGQNTVAGEA